MGYTVLFRSAWLIAKAPNSLELKVWLNSPHILERAAVKRASLNARPFEVVAIAALQSLVV